MAENLPSDPMAKREQRALNAADPTVFKPSETGGMSKQARAFIAIDLKSFYASVECRERGLDPLTTNLVVADASRTEKTIVLAVTPALKKVGLPGRPRLFEVVQKVAEANAARKRAYGAPLVGESSDQPTLEARPELALSYIIAPPRMAYYMDYSTRIFEIYLRFVSAEDIHVYSIDEVLIDATRYLKTYNCTAHELARRMIRAVLQETGITATAGIGTNLYLAKIAMDIVAKKLPADADGVRIAELDEAAYRRQLWTHRPITDFWRVGRGTADRLASLGLYTMGDVALCSHRDESVLYRLFGKNAELLIDHAWGWEPCEIAEIKAYQPESRSLCSGQVLMAPYPFDRARLIVREMIDNLSLELVEKGLVTNQVVLDVGYDVENRGWQGATVADRYGRRVPRPAHGSENLPYTASTILLTEAALKIFDRIADPRLTVRRLTVTVARLEKAELMNGSGAPPALALAGAANRADSGLASSSPSAEPTSLPVQLDMFTDPAEVERQLAEAREVEARRQDLLARERKSQEAIVAIRKRFGKNALMKGMNLEEGATSKERNRQIGGHKA